MHSRFFHGGPPHILGPDSQMRQDDYGFRPGHTYTDIIIRDLQLLCIVFIAAFIIHGIFRVLHGQFFVRGKPRKGEALLPAPNTTHEHLAAQDLKAEELVKYAVANLDSFTLSNLVFAIYRSGKLHVTPSADYQLLVDAVKPSVRKLKPRGAAHVLWGVARVKPEAEDLVSELCDVLSSKLHELRAVDIICSLWAAAELSPKDDLTRLNRLLLAADKVALHEFSKAECVSILATLAGTHVEKGAEWSGSSLVDRALKSVASDTNLLHHAEQTKLVRAVCVLQARDVVTEAVAGKVFKGVSDLVMDSTQPLQPRLEVLSSLPVTSAAARNARHVIARHTMDSRFTGLSAKDLVVLAATMAVQGLPESGEFYLELAQALQPLNLSQTDERTIRASFSAVGVSNLLGI